MSKLIDFNELNTRILNTQPDSQANQLGAFALATEAQSPESLADEALHELNVLEAGNTNRRETLKFTSHCELARDSVIKLTGTTRYQTSRFDAFGTDVDMLNRIRLLAIAKPHLSVLEAILEVEDSFNKGDRVIKTFTEKQKRN